MRRHLHHPLSPAADFSDDGGTRAWRANQTTYGRVIDAAPATSTEALKRWYRDTPLWKLMLLTLFVCAGLPWLIVIVGLLGGWGLYSLMGWQ